MTYEPNNNAIHVNLVESNPKNVKDKLYTGVGAHLFAEACRQSINKGYDGFVYFEAKIKLVEHYKKVLKAEVVAKNRMAIDEKVGKELVEKYYGKHKK